MVFLWIAPDIHTIRTEKRRERARRTGGEGRGVPEAKKLKPKTRTRRERAECYRVSRETGEGRQQMKRDF